MAATDTMRWMGRNARNRALAMGHSVKDRALEKRLDNVKQEADRLRFENDLLRDEVSETRSEHRRILDLLESRLSEPEVEVKVEKKKKHRGRTLMFLAALGGGAYALTRMRSSNGGGEQEWDARPSEPPTVTETGTAGI
jgi:hypothetical protein